MKVFKDITRSNIESAVDLNKIIVMWVFDEDDVRREGSRFHAWGYVQGYVGFFGQSKRLFFSRAEYEAFTNVQ